jgi:hypothetical protein
MNLPGYTFDGLLETDYFQYQVIRESLGRVIEKMNRNGSGSAPQTGRTLG